MHPPLAVPLKAIYDNFICLLYERRQCCEEAYSKNTCSRPNKTCLLIEKHNTIS